MIVADHIAVELLNAPQQLGFALRQGDLQLLLISESHTQAITWPFVVSFANWTADFASQARVDLPLRDELLGSRWEWRFYEALDMSQGTQPASPSGSLTVCRRKHALLRIVEHGP